MATLAAPPESQDDTDGYPEGGYYRPEGATSGGPTPTERAERKRIGARGIRPSPVRHGSGFRPRSGFGRSSSREARHSGSGYYKPDKHKKPEHPRDALIDETKKFEEATDKPFENHGIVGRFLRNKKNNIIATIIFGIIGVAYGGFSFLSGPFQLVHFSQQMDEVHFKPVDDALAFRGTKIIRWIRFPRNPEMRRMGAIRTRLAERWESNIRAIGAEPHYSPVFGYQDGFNVPEERFNDFRIETGLDELQEAGRITVSDVDVDGVRQIRFEGGTIRQVRTARAVNRLTMRAAGYNRVSGAIHTRTLNKRGFNVLFHPFGLLERKINQTLASWWADLRKQRLDNVKDGTVPTEVSAAPSEDDADSGRGEVEASDEVKDLQENSDGSRATTPQVEANLRSRIARAGGLTALAVGIFCIVKGIADDAEQIEYTNIVGPLIRFNFAIMSQGAQIMSGDGVSFAEIGEAVQPLYDEATKSSWRNARSLEYELGEEPTGPDIPDSAKLGGTENLLSRFTNILGGAGDAICSFSSSGPGQVAFVLVDLASSPGAALVGFLQGLIVGQVAEQTGVLHSLAGLIAGDQLAVDLAKGAIAGNYANHGGRHAANQQKIALGGKGMSDEESRQWREFELEGRRNQAQQKGFAFNYFDLNNPNSFASKVVDQTPPPGAVLDSVAKAPLRFKDTFAAALKSIIPKTGAYTYDYGFPEFGFSLEELNDPRLDDPTENEAAINDRIPELNEKYGDCYGVEIGDDGELTYSEPRRYDELLDDPDCNDGEFDHLRYRMLIMDISAGTSLACYEGDQASCDMLGANTQGTGTSSGGSGDTSGGPQPTVQCDPLPGLPAIPAAELLEGNAPNIPIVPEVVGGNNRVTGIREDVAQCVQNMLKAASDAGVTLAGNGFRSREEQQALRDANGCSDPALPSSACSPPTARPGESNHGWGVAIDFSSYDFGWLSANAATYGFHNLPGESWHWSIDGS